MLKLYITFKNHDKWFIIYFIVYQKGDLVK